MQTLLALLAIASAAFAQSPTKTLRFLHTTSEQNMMEIATVTRAISEVKPWADSAAKTLRIEGTSAQVSAAEWVFQELDRPAGSPPPDSPRVYKIDDPKQEGHIRVFHTAYTPNVQNLQELVHRHSRHHRNPPPFHLLRAPHHRSSRHRSTSRHDRLDPLPTR